MLFVAGHAIARFIERIAPYLTYEQAEAIVLADVKDIQLDDLRQAQSNWYVRVTSKSTGRKGLPYRYRAFIAQQELSPERGLMVVTIHRG